MRWATGSAAIASNPGSKEDGGDSTRGTAGGGSGKSLKAGMVVSKPAKKLLLMLNPLSPDPLKLASPPSLPAPPNRHLRERSPRLNCARRRRMKARMIKATMDAETSPATALELVLCAWMLEPAFPGELETTGGPPELVPAEPFCPPFGMEEEIFEPADMGFDGSPF